jgi:RNA-directed DNA polymerase
MSTAPAPVYEWKALPWRKLQRAVFKLQTRIYRAMQRGDTRTVHRLQRLMTTSRSAKLLAVRRVTQDNRGKRTAGVDGVKALTPRQRLTLATTLHLAHKPRPTRRVWIPKPGSTERRPLGIPVMRDRAAQALLKLALEPEWEAKFEPNSYGFRPGRSVHDAIAAIFHSCKQQTKYVLDADIAKCFDRIDHTALLRKLGTTPRFRRVIRGWLQAGVLDGPTLFPTEAGTPQGGVISPLLANIALHGLETLLSVSHTGAARPWQRQGGPPRVVRYADDFLILHPRREVLATAHAKAMTWLAELGLELKPSKTRVVHTLTDHEGHRPGFDFLGFTVRHFPAGRARSTRDALGRPRGYVLQITPSKAAERQHGRALGALIRQDRTAPQAGLIAHLNPVIRGWSRYYATVISSEILSRQDHLLYLKLRRWAMRRHPTKMGTWISSRYWRAGYAGAWTFTTADGVKLAYHRMTPIRRHVKVRDRRSPFDGDWSYWASRLGSHPDLRPAVARLLKRQRGTCRWCGLRFTMEDLLEIDHIVPLAAGGTRRAENLQLLHGHCHDAKTARDDAAAVQGTPDNEPRQRGAVCDESRMHGSERGPVG